MQFNFELKHKDKKTKARTGIIHTAHGDIQTPSFTPVATKASIKSLDMEDFTKTKSQAILANTYHLFLQPGMEVIEKAEGFAKFMNWSGPTITDSGGYQVSFIWNPNDKSSEDRAKTVKITDEGAEFTSHIDGAKHLLTPEKSMEIQKILGADIIMAFDQPMATFFSKKKNEEAMTRTFKWEERSFNHWKKIKSNQALYGILQGNLDQKTRLKFLEFVLSLDFPGIAVGDDTIGSDPKLVAESLDLFADKLPDNKPVHALGLGGGPEGIFAAVERGIDTFDNTGITRMARTGMLFLYPEDGGTIENKFRTDVTKANYKNLLEPFSKVCDCYMCVNFSKAYINHLFKANEMLGPRLATIHNIYFVNDLMSKIREAISNKDFISLKEAWVQ